MCWIWIDTQLLQFTMQNLIFQPLKLFTLFFLSKAKTNSTFFNFNWPHFHWIFTKRSLIALKASIALKALISSKVLIANYKYIFISNETWIESTVNHVDNLRCLHCSMQPCLFRCNRFSVKNGISSTVAVILELTLEILFIVFMIFISASVYITHDARRSSVT